MIFPVMMFSLGFLCAFLLAIVILPPFIRSSARNSTLPGQKKQKATLKQSRAEKDRMRAEYAIAIRKQEQAVEMLRARGQSQLIEIAECKATIRDMKREMKEITGLADRRYQEKARMSARLDAMGRAAAEKPPKTDPNDTRRHDPAAAELIAPGLAGKDQSGTGKSEPSEQNAPEPGTSTKPRLPGTADRKAEASDAEQSGSEPGLAGRIYRLKSNS